ncbi:hypothetical protein LCGC14_1748530 [marine sediment metagenome]|uniref:Uncharacterized protein n=1 Tax=marine sediment metagenome TaxID=412755 RepID=A0A0F9H4M0_9ZZZZ
MPLNPRLQKFTTASQSIATFDFVDIASGTGFEKFFMTGSIDSVGDKFILTSLSLAADNQAGTGAVDQTNFTADGVTRSFTTSAFNLPRTVSGNCYFSFTYNSSTPGGTNTLTAQIIVVDVDSNETDISSGGVTTRDTDEAATTMMLLEIPLTQTTIKEGEKLRLKITRNSSDGNDLTLNHNGSESFILVPFRINL